MLPTIRDNASESGTDAPSTDDNTPTADDNSANQNYDEEALNASGDSLFDDDEVNILQQVGASSYPDNVVEKVMLPPSTPHRSLLYRHRSPMPSSSGGTQQHAALLIRQEIDRIVSDSAVQTQHDVPVPAKKVRSSAHRGKRSAVRFADDDVPAPVPSGEKRKQLQFKDAKRALVNYAEKFKPFRTCNSFQISYTLRTFGKDAIAGVGVAIMEIPLAMSYAKLAGLPEYYGLYACFIPPIVYPLFGTSRQLAVGPASLVSLLIGTGISNVVAAEGFDDPKSQEYIARYTQLAIQCAFLSGLIKMGMGFLRLGFITQFLSKPLISGFVSGAAVLITCNQIKHLFGYSTPASNTIQEIFKYLLQNIDQFNWKTFVIGSLCLCLITLLKFMSSNQYLLQRWSGVKWLKPLSPILLTVVMIVLTYALNLGDRGIPLVQPIPPGLPSVTVTWWTPIRADLLVVVLSSVIISFVQSIALAKRIAYTHGYDVESSQELISLGLANLVGAMFQCYPTTGTIAQSAAADGFGAETGIASVITGFVVMIVLLLLTPVFQQMPLAVLGSIVIAFVSPLFDYTEAIYLFHVHFFDFLVWIVALFGTLFMGVTYGLAIAVVLSLIFVIYESAYPKMAVLGRLPGTSLYRNVKQYPDVERYDGVLIIRIDAPMYFANAQNIRDRVRGYKYAATADLKERNAGEIQYIIIDLSPMSHIDTTALHVVEDMYKTQLKEGVQICFCNPGIKVVERFVVSGFIDLVGREHFFSATIDAVQYCLNDMESRMQ